MAREINTERLLKDVKRVLENHFWIPELSLKEAYTRVHDDHDGTFEGKISIGFSHDGDAWIHVDKTHSSLRFRTFFGGGMSERTRKALMILAYAIKLDNEERPQNKVET